MTFEAYKEVSMSEEWDETTAIKEEKITVISIATQKTAELTWK
jgi:hypothetical protein